MKQPPDRQAVARTGWWPGWIWSIPIAALGLVLWPAIRSWTQAGPEVHVIFPQIADLKPGDTKVQFEGMTVGEVEASHLEPDLISAPPSNSIRTCVVTWGREPSSGSSASR